MKSVVLTSAILSLAVIVYNPEANAGSLPHYVSNAVTEQNQNIDVVKGDCHIQDTNTNYQLTSGDFLLYFFFFFICLILLFQVWLDYNFSRTKKHYK